MKKILGTFILIFGLTQLLPFQPYSNITVNAETPNGTFSDIQGHWAQKDIEFMASKGIVNGYPDGGFHPKDKVTYSQMDKMLSGFIKVEPTKRTSNIVKGHWAKEYIDRLVDLGVIDLSEFPNGYTPNSQMERIDVAKEVARALAKENSNWNSVLNQLKELDQVEVPFKDQGKIAKEALPYVALLNAAGIFQGSKGNFMPDTILTRAEVAAILTRYLDARSDTPNVSSEVEKYKGEPGLDISKSEMEARINRQADLERLATYPIVNDVVGSDISESNHSILYPTSRHDRRQIITEAELDPAVGFMEDYFNRDYRTIGSDFINKIRYYYDAGFVYNGDHYQNYELQKLFNRFVQETIDEKRISESIFVSDISMVYTYQDGYKYGDRVRGTQYIKYSSGTNLPEGVELNKWYKRDIDIQVVNGGYDTSIITWDVAKYTFDEIFPLTDYEEVK